MAFIISGAAAAAVAAASAGAITTGVAGAIAAGSVGATLAGIGAGAATAGALGAGIGAVTSAATGQDVGKGALMGGVTGLAGGVVGGVASAAGAGASAAGAIGGAAGGAAGAGAGGQDPLKGALIGGVVGGVGGALAPEAAAGSTTPQAGDAVAPTASSGGIGSVNAPAPTDVLTPKGLASIPTTPTSSTGALNEALPTAGQFSPTAAGNSSEYVQGMQGIGNPSTAVPAATPAPIAPSDTSISLQKGIDLVKAHPAEAMQVAGAGMSMLGSSQQEEQKLQPINTTNYLSPNFERYEAVPTYADGGLLGGMPAAGLAKGVYNAGIGGAVAPGLKDSLFGKDEAPMPQQQAPQQQAPQGPMNPIVAKAMAAAQQQQTQQGQQQGQPAPIQPTRIQSVPQQPVLQQPMQLPQQPIGMASGGITDGYSLGGYAHGGNPRLLKGPGTGISDDIPATIGHSGKQPARLATGEFVVPARIVSELGSGDTDAGGRVLQQMVDRIQARRAKTVGKGKVASDSKSHKVLPA